MAYTGLSCSYASSFHDWVPKLQLGNPVVEALASRLLSPLWNAIIRNRYHVSALPDRNGKSSNPVPNVSAMPELNG